jgi:hypothetical protein
MPMSKARKVLFAKYPWCDSAQAEKIHLQMERDYNRLLPLYQGAFQGIAATDDKCIVFTDDKDHNGNLIIESFLANNDPAKLQVEKEKYAKRQETRNKLFLEFRQVFGVNLNDYWMNPILGFNIIKFDEFIQSGDRAMYEVIREKYGERGEQIILELLA